MAGKRFLLRIVSYEFLQLMMFLESALRTPYPRHFSFKYLPRTCFSDNDANDNDNKEEDDDTASQKCIQLEKYLAACRRDKLHLRDICWCCLLDQYLLLCGQLSGVPSECFWSYVPTRVTRLGDFWMLLGTKFLAKAAQILATFLGYCEKWHFLC